MKLKKLLALGVIATTTILSSVNTYSATPYGSINLIETANFTQATSNNEHLVIKSNVQPGTYYLSDAFFSSGSSTMLPLGFHAAWTSSEPIMIGVWDAYTHTEHFYTINNGCSYNFIFFNGITPGYYRLIVYVPTSNETTIESLMVRFFLF